MYSGISLEAANCDPETAPLPDILPTGPFSARATECDQSLLKLNYQKHFLTRKEGCMVCCHTFGHLRTPSQQSEKK
jgi:hypothetical protein